MTWPNMMRTNIGRRLFLGRVGAAAAVVPVLAAVGTGSYGVAYPPPAGVMAGDLLPVRRWNVADAADGKLTDPDPVIEALLDQGNRRKADRRHYRLRGLDPDIAALRSVAPQHRAAMQRQRDAAERSILQALQDRLWPARRGHNTEEGQF